jgi:hypothetical protein
MTKDTAIVWWIERDTGELRSQVMSQNDLFRGGTYESEVRLKYARNPVEMTTIFLRRAGNQWEREELDRLHKKSQQMQQALALGSSSGVDGGGSGGKEQP